MGEGAEASGTARGTVLTLVASVLWGSSFVAIEVGLASVGPLLLVALRFELAALGAVAVAIALGRAGGIFGELRSPRIWFLGALYAAGFAFQFLGQAAAGIANSTLLSNIFPALVPLVAGPLLGERFGRRHGLAVLLSLGGLAAVTLPAFASGRSTLLGDLWLIASAADYAIFIVVSKRLRVDSPESSFALLIVMAGAFLPVVAFFSLVRPSELALSPATWGAVLYLAIPCTVAALTIYLAGLRYVSASRSSMLLLLEPVTGLLLAELWYRNAITLPVLVGAVLILGAIALACAPEGRSPSPTASSTDTEDRPGARWPSESASSRS